MKHADLHQHMLSQRLLHDDASQDPKVPTPVRSRHEKEDGKPPKEASPAAADTHPAAEDLAASGAAAEAPRCWRHSASC